MPARNGPIGRHASALPAVLAATILVAAACTSTSVAPSPTPATPVPTEAPTLTPTPTPTAAPTPAPTVEIVPGTPDDPREIPVVMTDDLRFAPERYVASAGETVRFLVSNPTAIQHDFTVGDEEAQAEHEAEMMESMGHGHMDGHHGAANAILLEPGESGELVYTFGEPGELLIGCHVPGHYAAGMRGTIEVIP